MDPSPRKSATSSFFVSSLAFGVLAAGFPLAAGREFAAGELDFGGAKLLIGVSHVDDLADGVQVGFSVAEEFESAAAEVGEFAFFGDLDFEFVGAHRAFRKEVGDF